MSIEHQGGVTKQEYAGQMGVLRTKGAISAERKFFSLSSMIYLFPMFLVGCTLGYGPPLDNARIESAVLHDDGRRCVFGFHDVIYRPATGMRAFPDGGIPRYLVDQHILAMVDVQTGEITLLLERTNKDFQRGQGGFHVGSVRGQHVLVTQGGQGRHTPSEYRWWHVQLSNGAHQQFRLREEFKKVGHKVKYAVIGDDDFTLIVQTEAIDGGSNAVWSRTRDGTLLELATTDYYYGVHDEQIWFYDPERRAGGRTNMHTGETVWNRSASFHIPRVEVTTGCQPTSDHKGLKYQSREPSGWVDHVLPVTAENFR